MKNIKIKAVIFDADGVLVHREKYFSEILAEKYGIPLEKSMKFFNGDFLECLVGRKDMKKVLPKYLKDWGWKDSLENLLISWFNSEDKIDDRLSDYIKKLRSAGIKIFIGTNNERYRTEYLRDKQGLGLLAHKVYGSGLIGIMKPDHRFFEHILNENHLRKDEVLFWDDDMINVESARSYGLQAQVYKDFKSFEKAMGLYGLLQ